MSSRRGTVVVIFLILAAVVVSAGGLLVLAGLFGAAAPPSVPTDAALYLRVQAPFDEVEPIDLLGAFGGRPPSTLRDIVGEIHRAKADVRIKALVLTIDANGALWAQLQELRDAVVDFRTGGKPVTAYLESAGAQEYDVATAADHIVLMPAGELDLSGLTTTELFFRGALDKLGIYPDLLHIGEYKTAANTFTEKGFTAAHKEMDESLNRDFYDELVRAIAQGRKKSEAEIRAAIDGGPYMAEEARRAGLVDALSYDDQLADAAPLKGTRRFDGEEYARIGGNPPGFGFGTRIALLYAVGTIASGKSSFDLPNGAVIGSDTFVQWVRKARIDPDIRAIVVRIDSPGGSAIASDVIWHELMLARQVKPVIVSMGDVAASGGYYIAVPAHVIVAEPGTITGSIGVLTGKFVVSGALDKLGIGEAAVSDGKMADLDSPFKPFSPEERVKIEDQLHTTYGLFLSRVAEGRKSTTDKIDAIGRGRVWTGRQGKANGLVDELGGLDRAIQIARTQAHVDPKALVELVIYPAKRGLLDLLTNSSSTTIDTSLGAALSRPDARVLVAAARFARLFRAGEPLTILPTVFWN